MRRKDKEIVTTKEIESIIKKAHVCRLAFSDNNSPYIVPLNFGYKDNCLYFHSAKEGKKIDIIKKNNKVCFEVDIDHQIIKSENPCDWTMRYASVVGYGKALLLQDREEKKNALDVILEHCSGHTNTYNEDLVSRIAIIKVEIESMTGKRSGY